MALARLGSHARPNISGTDAGPRPALGPSPRPRSVQLTSPLPELSKTPRYEIDFPSGAVDQDAEWCRVQGDGWERRFRFHDYGEIFELPGLYEQLFYEHLECSSPKTVTELLRVRLEEAGIEPGSLRALDVGAGNGMMGEQLAGIGVETLVGLDILPEAADATERDRPGLYDDYLVVDLTDLQPAVKRELESRRLNLLTCVAALGFDDIPPAAFAAAYDMLTPDGWLAFSIKEEFLADEGGGDFARVVRELAQRGMIEILTQDRYRHRLSAAGEPLHYVALVARRRGRDSARAVADAL